MHALSPGERWLVPENTGEVWAPLYTRSKAWPATESAVARARALVWAALSDWQLAELVDDAVLCVSELATNAVVHPKPEQAGWDNRPPLFAVVLRFRPHRSLVIAVEDGDANPPTLPVPSWPQTHPDDVDPYADDLFPELDVLTESARGLGIVASLSDFVSWSARPAMAGKAVWCRFDLAAREKTYVLAPNSARLHP